MEFGQLLFFGLVGLVVYTWITNPEKIERANKMGWDNVDKTGKVVKSATRFGIGVFRLFGRR